jgi:hypothetical protein
MTGKKTAKEIKPSTVVANDPDDLKGKLKNIGGSRSDHWNSTLANQTLKALWLEHSDPATREKQHSATLAALIGIGPKDELEGMMAAQLIAAHNAAMECYRRASAPKGNRNAFKNGCYTAEAVARRRELAALLRSMRALASPCEND